MCIGLMQISLERSPAVLFTVYLEYDFHGVGDEPQPPTTLLHRLLDIPSHSLAPAMTASVS
jgi:hypothetical protein